MPVLVVVVERVCDANALQEHVLRRRQPAILHFESDYQVSNEGPLTILVQNGVAAHGHDEKL